MKRPIHLVVAKYQIDLKFMISIGTRQGTQYQSEQRPADPALHRSLYRRVLISVSINQRRFAEGRRQICRGEVFLDPVHTFFETDMKYLQLNCIQVFTLADFDNAMCSNRVTVLISLRMGVDVS